MSNKDLLKQAIAEAKTIREAAIANAKEALEETLTPHLKEMLAQKLQEMELEEEEEDEKVMDENIYEAEEEEVEAEEGEEGAEEEAAEEEGNEEEEELEIEDMSVEDLKDLIRDIVAQETGQEEEADLEAGEEGPEGQEDMVSMDGDSEEIDINELLAELEGMNEQELDEKGGSIARDRGTSQGRDTGKEADIQMNNAIKSMAAKTGKSFEAISQFLYGGKKASPAEFEEGVEEGLGDTIKGAVKKVGSAINRGLERAADAGTPLARKIAEPGAAKNAIFREQSQDLNEALQAVKILRNQLQEVNLLNAKLLYVNKVFKSNNLSEGQKVNVIAAFDKAETVKEVKLVFETVSKNVVAKPAALKEHRSFASKATGNAQTTAPKEILSEVSEQVARWQKLAGIIKS
jgi:hypothetical protein